MRRDLRGRRSRATLRLQVLFDLLPPRTRCFQVLARVAFDLRLPVLAALDLVTHLLQPRRQLRTIHRRRVLLRLVQLLRLQRPRVAVGCLGRH